MIKPQKSLWFELGCREIRGVWVSSDSEVHCTVVLISRFLVQLVDNSLIMKKLSIYRVLLC